MTAVKGIATVTATFTSVKDGKDTVALDAHKKVTLTALTLDGEVTLNGEKISDSVGPGLSTTGRRVHDSVARPLGR